MAVYSDPVAAGWQNNSPASIIHEYNVQLSCIIRLGGFSNPSSSSSSFIRNVGLTDEAS